jgi:hypothetical protein
VAANYGGAIINATGTLNLINSTLSHNAATYGGGIYSNGALNYANTIIANSTSGVDCFSSGSIGININNIAETGYCSPQHTTDPLLGPLADNGGLTQTLALLPGSPALDAGDDATCASLPVSSLDQRGVVRPQGAHCDIGAYEYAAPAQVTVSGNVGVGGATLAYVDGGAKTVISDGSGNYSITVPPGWSGTVTPSKAGYTFSPASLSFSDLQGDQAAQNFSVAAWPAWAGGVSITSDQPVVTVARPHVGAEVMTYSGFEGGSTNVYVPMLFKGAFGGSYNAALYIQNISALPADLTLTFIDSTGATVYTKTNNSLAANASMGYWLPAEAGLPAGFAGAARVTSTQPIIAVGRVHIGTQVMTYQGVSAGAATTWLPMFFKNGFGTYNTALYVQNVTGSSATLSIQYLDASGAVVCTDNDILGAHASKGYWSLSVACDSGSLPTGFVGGVKVNSNQAVVAVARLHLNNGQITTYNGLANGATSVYVPMLFRNAFGGTYNTALYLQNVSGASATVTVEYLGSNGALAATQTLSLGAGAIGSLWLPSVPGLADGFVGGARITSTQAIVAVARPHLGNEVMAYNGAPAGGLAAYLPMLFKDAFGGGYDAALYVQNTSSSPANVTMRFFDTEGSLSCLKQALLPAGATVGYWLPDLACTP